MQQIRDSPNRRHRDSPSEMTDPIPTPEGGQGACSALSLQAQEPLPGSAPRVDFWLLLSYAGPMGAKALAESGIPQAVKDRLNGFLETTPNSRLLLVRPGAADADGKIKFTVGSGREPDPCTRTLLLDRYEDLLDLDLPALAAGEAPHDGLIERDPFWLVCTNGRRDPCCARYGLEVFDALNRHAENVWQCSHVSGHRFAANVVMFPHAIYYGRLGPEDSAALVQAGRAGEVLLEQYRGRACYDPVVQAGEALLREETGNRDLAAFRRLDHASLGGDLWQVRFLSTRDERVHELTLRWRQSEDRIPFSCQGEKRGPVVRYALELYRSDLPDNGN